MGRQLSAKQKINAQSWVTLNKMEYNEVGQLKQKSLNSTDGGSTFLQATRYAYNERGWLKGSVSPEFSMRLGYATLANPQFNGNISVQRWGAGSSYHSRFDYVYDRLNRLLNGTSTGTVAISEVIGYDVMGNISTLSRNGGGHNQYHYNGNQLYQVDCMAGYYAYDG